MKMSQQERHTAPADVDLMMECVDEELLPWQQAANAQAQKEYMNVCREIDEAKRRLIENQIQRQKELLAGGTTELIQPSSAVVQNQMAQLPDTSKYNCQEVGLKVQR